MTVNYFDVTTFQFLLLIFKITVLKKRQQSKFAVKNSVTTGSNWQPRERKSREDYQEKLAYNSRGSK